ncbi:MAG: hypothetical protein Q8R91_10805 [Candidatus Omnitrophota bacterium]|nr:hypothetical protein [Candidatus Omnitrophota bacterium]
MARIIESLQRKKQNLPEPHLHLVPSIVWDGRRWRAIWNTVHYRPLDETFHEFIIYRVLLPTFGEDWRKEQMTLPKTDRHILIRWVESYSEWKKLHQQENNKEAENRWSAAPSGEVLALHQFAYDAYCLQTINRLPDFLVHKLKNVKEFQGARYEVAVAAVIARAGYEITFLDEQIKSEKHCEFIAKNKYSGEEIGVEAKSRRRMGVIHEKGESDPEDLVKGDVGRLFRKACAQRPNNMPYLIFIDLNVMPTPGIPTEKKPWVDDVKAMLVRWGEPSSDNPEPFNALVLTNFSYYYAGNAGDAPRGEYVLIVSQYPQFPSRGSGALGEIWEGLERYSHIPHEV